MAKSPRQSGHPDFEHQKLGRWPRYGFLWVTLGLFAISLAGHWIFGWFAYVEEAREHHSDPSVSAWTIEMARETLENWQSEFLQLVWQVAGLAFLLHVGSPSSKESDERIEEKLDFLMSKVEGGEHRRREIDHQLFRD